MPNPPQEISIEQEGQEGQDATCTIKFSFKVDQNKIPEHFGEKGKNPYQQLITSGGLKPSWPPIGRPTLLPTTTL